MHVGAHVCMHAGMRAHDRRSALHESTPENPALIVSAAHLSTLSRSHCQCTTGMPHCCAVETLLPFNTPACVLKIRCVVLHASQIIPASQTQRSRGSNNIAPRFSCCIKLHSALPAKHKIASVFAPGSVRKLPHLLPLSTRETCSMYAHNQRLVWPLVGHEYSRPRAKVNLQA